MLARRLDPDAVAAVVERLAERGLASDARFAAAYVDQRIRAGFGPLRIRAELCQRGLDPALVATYLDQDEDYWSEQLAAAQRKKFGAQPARTRQELARRARFLEYRGFSSGQIGRMLDFAPLNDCLDTHDD